MNIANLLLEASRRVPDNIALISEDDEISYGQLNRTCSQMARCLQTRNINPHDVVAIAGLTKRQSIVVMQAVLRLGAVYMPINTHDAALRTRKILTENDVKAIITSKPETYGDLGPDVIDMNSFTPGDDGDGVFEIHPKHEDDAAYILNTSGSETPVPKSVVISHRAAANFIAWSTGVCALSPADRVLNLSPFWFDISVFDIYATFSAAGTLVLPPVNFEENPLYAFDYFSRHSVTVAYSVPSLWVMFLRHRQARSEDFQSVRLLAFAGEVFPIKELKDVRRLLPDKVLFNFYGPTETNVITYYEIRDIGDDIREIPIGIPCAGNRVWIDKDGREITEAGIEGELVISGPSLMNGYAGALCPSATQIYRTGDIVQWNHREEILYVGRKNSLCKFKGMRINLEEIETVVELNTKAARAICSIRGKSIDAKLELVIQCPSPAPSLSELNEILRHHYAKNIRVSRLVNLEEIPLLHNGKTDRRRVREILDEHTG